MNRFLMGFLLISVTSWAAVWESFPLRENGSIPIWLTAGPFPNKLEGAGSAQSALGGMQIDFLQASGGEAKTIPTEGDQVAVPSNPTVIWKTTFSENSGLLNFLDICGVDQTTPGAAYVFCRLDSEKAQEVLFNLHNDNGCRIWLNHTLIYEHLQTPFDDKVKVSLDAGNNYLLCKVDQSHGDWYQSLVLTGLNGEPVSGIQASIAVNKPLKGKFLSAKFSSNLLVLKTPEGEKQALDADIESGGMKDVTCRIASESFPKEVTISLGDLAVGKQKVEIKVPTISGDKPIQVTLESATDKKTYENVPVPSPKKWTIYLTQHTHTDIGYTRPQTEILPEHLRYIDYALEYCDLTDDYPDDAKFRWTCETSWAVREYLKRRPQEQIDRLKKRLQEGRIEIAGMLLNMAETATESSMAASLKPLRTFKEEFGIEVRTAMQDDVNGAAWCLVDYFSQIGLRYLTMGINQTRSILPFDRPTPFWWESPSGKRVLAYRSDHYMTANEWQIHTADIKQFKPKVLNYLQSLEKRKYPFDRIGVQFSGYLTDNSPPAKKECDLVKQWNETYAWPKLRMSTAHEYPEYIEKEHSNELPVYRAAWPDWWTDGFGSAARETAAARATHTSVKVSSGLFTMASILGASVSPDALKRITDIQEDLLFYDEHTWGAAESISDPMAENTMVQWAEKSSYAWTAVKNSNMLREEAFGLLQGFLPRAEVSTIAVFNTLNWKRSGLVRIFIDHEILPSDREFRIIDTATSAAIPAQKMSSRTEGSYWALWVPDVLPMGYKILRIEVSQNKSEGESQGDSNTVLENSFYKITIDPQKGAVTSLVDKETGQELVDPNCDWSVGQCFYERLMSKRENMKGDYKRTSLRGVKAQAGSNGPIWKSILLSADMDGCAEKDGMKVEIRLYETEKRIEFLYTIRKLPITDPEAVYVSFPFQLPDSKIVYEAQGGFVTPGVDQIPGSSSDWQTIQSFIAVRNADSQIVLGSEEAPLVQLGEINLGKFQPVTKVEKPHIYSWVMNNYWFTNFRATQEGEFKWSYYLTSNKDTGNVFATHFGWGSRVPLVTRVLPPGKSKTLYASPSLSTLTLQAPNLLLVESRPAIAEGAIFLHLREIGGKEITLEQGSVEMPTSLTGADEVNVLEQPMADDIRTLSIQPYEVKFTALKIE